MVLSAPPSMKCPPSCGICAYFMDIPKCATWISPHDMRRVQNTVFSLCGLMYLPIWTNGIWEDSPAKTRFSSEVQFRSYIYAQIIPDHVEHCIDKCCACPKLSLGTHFRIPQTLRLTYLLTVDYPGEICTSSKTIESHHNSPTNHATIQVFRAPWHDTLKYCSRPFSFWMVASQPVPTGFLGVIKGSHVTTKC